MMSRVHRRVASRIAAALVAIALSGVADVAVAASRAATDAHVCRCPRGDHRCTCPVCSRAGLGGVRDDAARRQQPRSGARQDGPRHLAGAEEDARCGITSACHLPEAGSATDGQEPFTLEEVALAVSEAAAGRAFAAPVAPATANRRPAVPPPRR